MSLYDDEDYTFDQTTRTAESKCWHYRLCNYDPATLPIIPDVLCVYRIEGKEIAPTTGTPHVQCFVHLKKPVRLSALKKIHPTATFLKAKGSPYQNFVYCSKDNDFIEFGTRPGEDPVKRTRDMVYAEAFSAPTVREGMEILYRDAPRDMALNGDRIEANMKRRKMTHKYKHTYTPDMFNIPLQDVSKKPLLIHGNSDCGKSKYAFAHFKNPLIVNRFDKLREFSDEHDGIVYNDMSFRHMPPETVIAILEWEDPSQIIARYSDAEIPPGTPRIFTHNSSNPFFDPLVVTDVEQQIAITRRYNTFHVTKKLYD